MANVFPHQVDYCKTTIGGLPAQERFVSIRHMNDTQNEYIDLGKRLRCVRVGFSDLSQQEWAAKHGFTTTQYNNWEQGLRRITVDAAELLCDRYGLTLDFIYRGRRDGLSETASKVL